MLIIAGSLHVPPGDRDAAVAAHHDLMRRGRAAPGCLDLAISPDPLDPGRINNYERWASREDLEAWRAVAHAPEPPTTIRDVTVMEYEVTGERSPFG